MLREFLNKRKGHDISDEEEEAYILGFKDACAAMRSDHVYYDVANTKQGISEAIVAAANYIERYEND